MAGYSWPDDFFERRPRKKIKEEVLRTTLYRLKKRGFVEHSNRVWKLTMQGSEYLKTKLACSLPSHYRKQLKSKRKNLIVAFDIPETMRRKRDWLREELVVYGFEQLQKSVWFGPGPLSQKFIENCGRFDILPYIRFFQATEKEIIGDRA